MSATRTIRLATEADTTVIAEIWRDGDRHHAAALPDRFREAAGPASSPEIADPNAALFVGEEDGVIVGAMRVILKNSNPYPNVVPRTHGEINALVVRETHRGKGVGSALIEAAQAWTVAHGADEVELNVWEFNREAI